MVALHFLACFEFRQSHLKAMLVPFTLPAVVTLLVVPLEAATSLTTLTHAGLGWVPLCNRY